MIEQLGQDTRYALRMFRKNPGFRAVVIVTLALCIGANTVIFGLIDATLLKSLSVPHPEQLLQLTRVSARHTSERFPYRCSCNFERERRRLEKYSDLPFARLEGESRESVVQLSSGEYFRAIGVSPIMGCAWIASALALATKQRRRPKTLAAAPRNRSARSP